MLYYIIYLESQTHTHNFLVIVGKSRNEHFFGKILFLPVMTKQIVISKEHCSPTRSKTVFFLTFC